MKIYIKNERTKTKLQIPVLPAEFSYSSGNALNTVNVNNYGEVVLQGKPTASSLSFSSFFPAQKYGFCVCKPKKPYRYCEILKKWQDKGERVLVNLTGTNIRIYAYIESFDYQQKDVSGDVYYSIQFRERRVTKTVKREIRKFVTGDKAVAMVSTEKTVAQVSRKYLGTSEHAKEIADLNGIKWDSKLERGQVVRLPFDKIEG